MMYWGNGWGMLLMTLSTLVFWGLMIGGIVFLVYQFGSRGQPAAGPPRPDPQQILAERYARGEIDEEEYHRRLNMLRGGSPSAPST